MEKNKLYFMLIHVVQLVFH